MNILLVAIPGAILLGTIILGFILAPYLIYEEEIKVIQQERDELKGQVESKISKRRMRETIAELLKKGEQIKRQCRNEKEEAPEKAALDWSQKVAKYLTENLGSDYEVIFYNSDGLPIGVTTISSPEHSRIESYVRNRIARLNQFLAELRT